MAELIITVTPTIMDGTVVRWFAGMDDAGHCRPFLSASRNGVVRHTDIPMSDQLVMKAMSVRDALAANHDADLHHLATHRRDGILGPLVATTTTEACSDG